MKKSVCSRQTEGKLFKILSLDLVVVLARFLLALNPWSVGCSTPTSLDLVQNQSTVLRSLLDSMGATKHRSRLKTHVTMSRLR